MIFHVQNARRVVGAFNGAAKLEERKAVGAQHRAVGDPIDAERDLFDEPQKLQKLAARLSKGAIAFELEPGSVDRLPHFDSDRGAH